MTDSTDLRMRGSTTVDVDNLPGTIHPFMANNQSLLKNVTKEIASVLALSEAKRICCFLGANILCTVLLLLWCNSSNSMALTSYAYLTIFDMFSLLTCLVSLWVKQQKPTPIFSLGYERFEVLAVFASTILAQFGSLFIIKEGVERMIEQPDIHTSRLLIGMMCAFLFHMTVTYFIDNKAFNHVISASSSSWLQEHVSDISESICHVCPGMSKLLLPRINPFALIAFGGGSAIVIVYILIDLKNYHAADTWAAMWIALMTCGTMFPMSAYSGKILLQTTPTHIIGQLDKCLREASTLDGVLEFRYEHFWTLSFGTMAGSVHVRTRRDADEQMVLAHVYNRLNNLVSQLTVQIFKDDWSRPSAFQIIGDTSLLTKLQQTAQGGSPNRAPSPESNLYNVRAAPVTKNGTGIIPMPTSSSQPNSLGFSRMSSFPHVSSSSSSVSVPYNYGTSVTASLGGSFPSTIRPPQPLPNFAAQQITNTSEKTSNVGSLGQLGQLPLQTPAHIPGGQVSYIPPPASLPSSILSSTRFQQPSVVVGTSTLSKGSITKTVTFKDQ